MLPLTSLIAAVSASEFGKAIDPVIKNIVNPAIEILFAVALLIFAYSVARLIWGSAEGEDRANAKRSMLGGIIGMFIMLSAWGIVYVISNTVKTF
ncbi:MAG: hypothetical protein WCG02_04240 [Candidatus Taylorbacteria bacterium]